METTAATAQLYCARRYIPVEMVMTRNVTRPITAGAYNQDIDKRLAYWSGNARLINILPLIALFYLVVHVTLNSHNTNLKNDGVGWG